MLKNMVRNKLNRGFTLAELLVALTLLVIAATAFLPVFSFVARSNNENKIKSTANMIASSIFEEISSLNYDDIGTIGGTPEGDILRDDERTIDGVKYQIQTLITWGSTEDTDGSVNPTAYKNIRVIIKATGAFSGTLDVYDKMFSITAKEGGQVALTVGNIKATVKNTNNLGLSSAEVRINATGPGATNFSMVTDYGGEVLFGQIPIGTYDISAIVPHGYQAPRNDPASGTIVRTGVDALNWDVVDVYFYMDKPQNFSNINVKLIDSEGNPVTSGTLRLYWTMDDITRNIYQDDCREENQIDRLWPLGTYNLVVDFPYSAGYVSYNMKTAFHKPYIQETGIEWDGTFDGPGDSKTIIVPISSGPSIRDAFSRIEAEYFDEKSGPINISDCNDGGPDQQINKMNDGSYTLYRNVDFKDGAFMFLARAAGNYNRNVSLRIDNRYGTEIGTLNFMGTGGTTKFQTQSCWVNGVSGIHDLYLVYSGGMGLNWFTFERKYSFDDFNDKNLSKAWQTKNGSWSETDGILRQTSTGVADPKKAIIAKGGFDATENLTIRAKVRVDRWQSGGRLTDSDRDMCRAGVGLFTDKDTGYGYNLLFHKNMNTVQFLDDKRSWSTEFNFQWSVNQWYWFMLRSEGRNLYGKIWSDGEKEPSDWMFTWTVPDSQRTGYPALNGGSGYCTVSFDDVAVMSE